MNFQMWCSVVFACVALTACKIPVDVNLEGLESATKNLDNASGKLTEGFKALGTDAKEAANSLGTNFVKGAESLDPLAIKQIFTAFLKEQEKGKSLELALRAADLELRSLLASKETRFFAIESSSAAQVGILLLVDGKQDQLILNSAASGIDHTFDNKKELYITRREIDAWQLAPGKHALTIRINPLADPQGKELVVRLYEVSFGQKPRLVSEYRVVPDGKFDVSLPLAIPQLE